MKVIVVLSVQLLLLGLIPYPVFADSVPATVIQRARIEIELPQVVIDAPQVLVQQQPVVVQSAPVLVQPPPVLVQQPPVLVQPPPALVQLPPVVVEPYPVVEGGVNIPIDPEDYYYVTGGIYYHHYFRWGHDEVVQSVPSGRHLLHSRIDVSNIPLKHFRHATHKHNQHDHPLLRALEKQEKRDR